jgi:hypothetical protein
MSRLTHRQPVWNWGTFGVVLLSTLLLSPVAGTALWHALFAAEYAPQQTAPVSRGQQQAAAQAPRRVSPDEEALRAAARNGQLRAIRLDTDPDHPGEATIALVVPTRTLLLVSDEATVASGLPPRLEAASPPYAAAPSAPRAPPFV